MVIPEYMMVAIGILLMFICRALVVRAWMYSLQSEVAEWVRLRRRMRQSRVSIVLFIMY